MMPTSSKIIKECWLRGEDGQMFDLRDLFDLKQTVNDFGASGRHWVFA